MKNNMIKAITSDGSLNICAVDSTDLVAGMERIHQTSAVASAALGRLLTAAALMGSWQKAENDTMTLRLNGGGPLGSVLAVSDGHGNVRGYVQHPIVEMPLRPDGKLDVGGAVGKNGIFSVVKDMGFKEPYIGQTPLVSGEVGEDVTAYYAASEQTPSVCALGVLVNPRLSIRRAGGYLLQLMPGANEAATERIEHNIAGMPSVTQLLEMGATPLTLIERVLAGLRPQVLEERRVEYRCYCSRKRTRNMLASLGLKELEQMRKEKETVQVECHFCNKKYSFCVDTLIAEMNYPAAEQRGAIAGLHSAL